MAPRSNSDPNVKVTVFMPASLYQRLREHAERTGQNMSQLCRDAALAAIAAVAKAPE
jgi:hypothetical protein